MQCWRNVIQRIVAVVKILSSRALPLCGNDEVLRSVHNGYFLICTELNAKFGPFLASHLSQYKDFGEGKTLYLSITTYEEVMKITRNGVGEEVVTQGTAAKYFSSTVDISHDISHK